MSYQNKYLKYKNKYLDLKTLVGGSTINNNGKVVEVLKMMHPNVLTVGMNLIIQIENRSHYIIE
jgi:hypothetical protein